MTVLSVIRESLRLLSRKDSARLALVTGAQLLNGFLDLLGVALIGAVGAIALSLASDESLLPQVDDALDRLGWRGIDPVWLAAWLTLAAGLTLILKTVLSMLLTRITFHFLARRQASLSAQLASRFLALPLLTVQSRSSQDTAYLLTIGTRSAIVGILGATSSAIADVGLLFILAFGLLAIDPTVTVFAVLYFSGITWILHRLLSKWAARLGKVSTDADMESYTVVSEAVATYREAVVSNRRPAYVDEFQRLRWQSAMAGADFQFVGLIPKYVSEVAIVVGGLLLVAAMATTQDISTAVAILAVFLVAAARIMPALLRLQATGLVIKQAEASANLVYQLARDLGGLVAGPRVIARSILRDDVVANNSDFDAHLQVMDVSLKYEGTDYPALSGVSFEASAGMSVALVGATGAGKSTLADVVLGVVAPDQGAVLVGGIDPGEASKKWPGGLAYVPQDVVIVAGSVRRNVGLGLPSGIYSDEEVWEALSKAHLAEFLSEYRDGLDTVVGERGLRLSGGQRQRLGLARALLTSPKLLVLDEATSALDAATESLISDAVRGLHGSVTTVTIAHRLATIRQSDLVIELQNGHVSAAGAFEEVREKSATFRRQTALLGL